MINKKNLSLMIKPASSSCNLHCDYCFYFDEAENRESPNRGVMETSTLEHIVKKAFEQNCPVSFIFQGGEPSLVGLNWFRKFIEFENQYKKEDSIINHFFQTNGTTIDKEWAVFFKENNFLVGISYDGHNRIQDIHRKLNNGEKSSKLVSSTINLLNEYKVEYNILTVVTNEVALNIELIYKNLLKKGVFYHQYIACLDPISCKKSFLDPETYGNFLITLFDLWRDSLNRGYKVSIRLFENFISILLGYQPEACDMLGNCSIQYVFEADGSVYPCDFYCLDKFLLGNINEVGFDEFDEKRKEINFIERSYQKPQQCVDCKFFKLCRGGCPRYKDKESEIFKYCQSYKMLFNSRLNQMIEMADSIRRNS